MAGACGEILTIEQQVDEYYGPPHRPQLARLSHWTGEPYTDPSTASRGRAVRRQSGRTRIGVSTLWRRTNLVMIPASDPNVAEQQIFSRTSFKSVLAVSPTILMV